MAAEDILKQEIIAAHLRILYKEVRTLKKTLNEGNRADELGDSEQTSTHAFQFEQRFTFDVISVTSVIDDNTFLAFRTIPSTIDSPGWFTDPEFSSKPIVVTKAPNYLFPLVGDLVPAFFTGTYDVGGVPTPRYGSFTSRAVAGRFQISGTLDTGDGVVTTIPFVTAGSRGNVGGAVTVAAGVFTVSEKIALMIGGFATIGDDPGDPGFAAARPAVRLRLADTGAPGGTIRTRFPGSQPKALTTSTDDDHSHTVAEHNHDPRAGIELTVGPAVWFFEPGDTFRLTIQQNSGFSARVGEADISFARVA